MWWAGRARLDVFLGSRTFAVCIGETLHCLEQGCAAGDSLEALARWTTRPLTPAMPATYRLWFSAAIAQPLLMEPAPGLRGARELRQAAAALASRRLGVGACAIRIGEAPARASASVVVAVEERWQAAVVKAFAGSGRRLASAKPWWSEALGLALQRDSRLQAVGVLDPDGLAVLGGSGSAFDVAEATSPVRDEPSARAAMTRALLRAGGEPRDPGFVRLCFDRPTDRPTPCAFGAWMGIMP